MYLKMVKIKVLARTSDRKISTKTTAFINKKKLLKLTKENCQLYHWWSDLWMGVNLNCRSNTLACRTPPPQK